MTSPLKKEISILNAFLFTSLLALGNFFKVNYIIGSEMAFFTATNCTAPMAGAWGGFSFACLVFVLRCLFLGANPLLYAIKHVSSLCAAWYLSTTNIFFHLILPLLCMLLFVIHPVGSQAFIYSFYWFIPVVLYFVKFRSFFAQAVGSTFIAHAVGSVIWLYTVPMEPAQWLGLIPVVWIERLVFAAGMMILNTCFHYINQVDIVKRLKRLLDTRLMLVFRL